MAGYIDVVFDGPPAHESGRFIEVEDETGASIRVGEWVERESGLWALRIPRSELATPAPTTVIFEPGAIVVSCADPSVTAQEIIAQISDPLAKLRSGS